MWEDVPTCETLSAFHRFSLFPLQIRIVDKDCFQFLTPINEGGSLFVLCLVREWYYEEDLYVLQLLRSIL